ncbi:MAG: protein kinase [bacterium]
MNSFFSSLKFLIYIKLQLLILIQFATAQEINPGAYNYYKKGLKAESLTDKIKNYQKAVKIDSSFKEALYYLGITYYQKGFYNQAIKYLNEAVRIDSAFFKEARLYLRNAYTFLSNELNDKENYHEALKTAQKATNLDKNFAPAYTALGLVYYNMDTWQAAIEALEKSIALNSNQEMVWSKLGNIYLSTGDFKKSVEAYEKALAIEPNLKEAQVNLKIAKKKNSIDSWMARFENAETEGRWDEGIEILKKAQTVYPNNSIIENSLKEAIQEKEYLTGLQAVEDQNWALALDIFQMLPPDYKATAEKLVEAKAALSKKDSTKIIEEPSVLKISESSDKSPDTSQVKPPTAELVSASNERKNDKILEEHKKLVNEPQELLERTEETDTLVKTTPEKHLFTSQLKDGPIKLNSEVKIGKKSSYVWAWGILSGVLIFGLVLFKYHKKRTRVARTKKTEGSTVIDKTQVIDSSIPDQKSLSSGIDEIFKDEVASVTPTTFDPKDSTDILNEKNNQKKAISTPLNNDNRLSESQETQTILGGIKQVKRIGRYILEKEIGRGSMGHIYKAWDPKLDRTVVIKQVAFDFSTKSHEIDKLKERMFREARAAGSLNHPNIVIIYDVDEEEDFSYIVMEYLQGEDLKFLLETQGKFEILRTIRIISQICNALNYAHQNGIVHCDIKPSNIILIDNDKVKVADFGIAKLPQFGTLTQTGNIIGTPFYMSPEQIAGKKVDGRSDIFSVGVLLYEMLTGIRPFDGDNIPKVVYKIVHKEPKPLSKELEGLPQFLDEIINRALAKDPNERYTTAADLLLDFKKLQGKYIKNET